MSRLTLTFAAALLIASPLLPAASPQDTPLANSDVIAMTKAGIPDDAIILIFNGGATDFAVDPSAVASLSTAGVSERVLAAMKASAQSIVADHTAAPSSRNAALTNQGVVDMVRAGLSDDVVLMAVQRAPTTSFDTSSAGLVALQRQGVPSSILKAMLERHTAPTSATDAAKATGDGAIADPDPQNLVREVRQAAKQVADFSSQRDKAVSELRTSENNARMGQAFCERSTIVGAANCLTMELNTRAAISSRDQLAKLEVQLREAEGRLGSLRAALSGNAAALALLDTADPSTEAALVDVLAETTAIDAEIGVFKTRVGKLMLSSDRFEFRSDDRVVNYVAPLHGMSFSYFNDSIFIELPSGREMMDSKQEGLSTADLFELLHARQTKIPLSDREILGIISAGRNLKGPLAGYAAVRKSVRQVPGVSRQSSTLSAAWLKSAQVRAYSPTQWLAQLSRANLVTSVAQVEGQGLRQPDTFRILVTSGPSETRRQTNTRITKASIHDQKSGRTVSSSAVTDVELPGLTGTVIGFKMDAVAAFSTAGADLVEVEVVDEQGSVLAFRIGRNAAYGFGVKGFNLAE